MRMGEGLLKKGSIIMESVMFSRWEMGCVWCCVCVVCVQVYEYVCEYVCYVLCVVGGCEYVSGVCEYVSM